MWGIRMVNVVVSSVVMMMISSVVHIGNKGNVVTAFRSVVPTISSVSISQQQQQTNQFHQLSNNNNNYDNKLSTTSRDRISVGWNSQHVSTNTIKRQQTRQLRTTSSFSAKVPLQRVSSRSQTTSFNAFFMVGILLKYFGFGVRFFNCKKIRSFSGFPYFLIVPSVLLSV